jgi:hypothetical protein
MVVFMVKDMTREETKSLSARCCLVIRKQGDATMGIRTLALCATASLFLGGAAIAQTSTPVPGDTSGPAAGGNTNPSTAVQKNRSSSKDMNNMNDNMGSSTSAGAPGVEGPAGSENGAAPQTNKMK